MNNLTYFKLLLFLPLIFLFTNCENKSPVPEDKFIKVYVDMMILQDTTGTKPVSLDSMRSMIFNRYEITDKDYNATLNYYNSSPEKWDGFFKKAIAYVEKLKTKTDD